MNRLTAALSQAFSGRERSLAQAARLVAKEHFHAALIVYRRAAERGSVDAMMALAGLYERGQGTPISIPQALKWYQAAAEQGHVDGHFGAGCCLMRMERIPRGVRGWYQSVADDEPARAAELGALLGTRMDIGDPYELARKHLVEACRQGHAEAHYRLAELLVRGLGGERAVGQAHDLYIVAAAAGIAGAEYGLGELYRSGEGCEADSETALVWYKRAAGRGHVPAQLMVAQQLITHGTPEDAEQARFWLGPGSEQGAPHADFLLAVIDLAPATPDRDVERGKTHLRRAAAKGHLHAMKQLAQIYDEGLCDEARDQTEAAGWYKKAAEAGDAESQFAIGRMYARGEGVPQVSTSAARWFARSAEGGHVLATFNCAILLERGEGVSTDPAAARGLFIKAAERGLAAAQFKLGSDLLNENPAQLNGVAWLEKAASQHHVGALALLGLLYGRGEHVAKDVAVAITYLERAAALGHIASHLRLAAFLRMQGAPVEEVIKSLVAAADGGSSDAELALAQMYFDGDGVDVDLPVGLTWLEKAASHGHPQALFDLGVRYCRGDGVSQDVTLGEKFYGEAGNAGHIVGKFNYALMVLSRSGADEDRETARRSLRDAALSGLTEAQEACRTYQVAYEFDDMSDEPDLQDSGHR